MSLFPLDPDPLDLREGLGDGLKVVRIPDITNDGEDCTLKNRVK